MGHRNCSNIKLEHVGIYAAKHEEGLSLPWQQLVLFLSSLVADDKNHPFPAECRSGIETNPDIAAVRHRFSNGLRALSGIYRKYVGKYGKIWEYSIWEIYGFGRCAAIESIK
jgi:hypothetical protein